MNEPSISIIIPVYNSALYLTQCVESVLKQSFKNFELILVDDGSSDNSGLICDRYQLIDARIKVIHTINRGCSAARNTGLDVATGKYISFVDSDDYVHPDFLTTLFNAATKYNSDISAIYRFKFFDDQNIDAQNLPIDSGKEVFTDRFEDYYHLFEERANLDIIWNKLYKKELFGNLRFPEGKRYEDVYLIHRILARCKSMCVCYKHMYFYRKHQNSFMSNNDISDLLWVKNSLIDFYLFEFKNNNRLEQVLLETIQITFDLSASKKQSGVKKEIAYLKKEIKFTLKKGIIKHKKTVLLLRLYLLNGALCRAALKLKRKK